METFRRVPRFMEEKRDKKAREIRESWLGKKYFFGPDSPATREGRNLVSFSRLESWDYCSFGFIIFAISKNALSSRKLGVKSYIVLIFSYLCR